MLPARLRSGKRTPTMRSAHADQRGPGRRFDNQLQLCREHRNGHGCDGQMEAIPKRCLRSARAGDRAEPECRAEPNHVTTYAYDLLGHLTQAQMPRTVNGSVVTQTRSWTYDPGTQLLTQTTTPEAGTTAYTYNADASMATKTDAKGQQIQYSYDPYGRVSPNRTRQAGKRAVHRRHDATHHAHLRRHQR